MSRETANAARFNKGLCVLTDLEGELLEALEASCCSCKDMYNITCHGCEVKALHAKAHGE